VCAQVGKPALLREGRPARQILAVSGDSMTEKIRNIRAPRGMADVMPDDMPWVRFVEDTARRVFEIYGYREIRSPMFEETRLFVRGIGEATDIVEKEMYTFGDPSAGGGPDEESLTLRPESTAPTVRAYLERGLDKTSPFQKFFYIGPMFRHERPQAGRMREFYQLGVEAIGSYEPIVDAETMLCAMEIFEDIGLAGCKLKINSIGCPDCRAAYRDVLRNLLAPHLKEMCVDCQARFNRNIFRLLDCKNPQCKAITQTMPPMRDHLDQACREHFEAVQSYLRAAGQEFVVDDHLVRGFDYYTRTVYEISNSLLGARDAVAGGGRYDNLVADIGGPPTGAAGFAIGEVPTLLALKKQTTQPTLPGAKLKAFIVAVDDASRAVAFRIAQKLRKSGVYANTDFQKRSAKAQMRSASRDGAEYVIVVGPEEIAAGKYTVKNMTSGEQRKLAEEEILAALRQ
jgi:histidyl-tRNA synthetase